MEASSARPDIAAVILGRDDILKAEDRNRKLVEMPEWGGLVWVYAMSGTERDAFEQSILEIDAKGNTRRKLDNVRAKMCAACLGDESGARLFTASDIDVLGAKSAKALDRVFAVAQELNGMDDKDVEELAGN